MKYMGSHDVFERYLVEFTKGQVIRHSFAARKRYGGQLVIDMSKIRMDFARNEVSDNSFICLDPGFFQHEYKPAEISKDKEESKAPQEAGKATAEETKSPDKPEINYNKLSDDLQKTLVNSMRYRKPRE